MKIYLGWESLMVGVIVGNLAMDVRGLIPSNGRIADFSPGRDVVVNADSISATLGGSSWLFFEALRSLSLERPLLLGCVGEDEAGDFLIGRLSRLGISTTGIWRSAAAPTSTVMLMYLPDGSRLMVRPTMQANDYLSPAFVDDVLKRVGEEQYRFVWLSGYALVHKDSDRVAAVKVLCEWARSSRRPIFLDLVPHSFSTSVGSIARVVDQIGIIDGVVAELRTYCGLGYCPANAMTADAWEACKDSVRKVSVFVQYAVAQHRLDSDRYLQVIGNHGEVIDERTYDIDNGNVRGMGDVMSVDALRILGVL